METNQDTDAGVRASSPVGHATLDLADLAADPSIPIPRRLPRFLSNTEAIDDADIIADFEEDNVDGRDAEDGDSDDEGAQNTHHNALELAQRERAALVANFDDDEVLVQDNEFTAFLADKETSISSPPADWQPTDAQAELGEPQWEDVDNPGKWSRFTFRPKFVKDKNSSTKKYSHHALPGGVQVCPKDSNGKRTCNGWEFHYREYKKEGAPFRNGATKDNPFPDARKGSLDKDVLKKLGLTKARMEDLDALFFYQLLLPICDPMKSGIPDDPRSSLYHDVQCFTTLYSIQEDLGAGSYGHHLKPIETWELLHFDGVVVCDGMHGGSNGAVHCRWIKKCADYNQPTDSCMTHRRWLQVKRCYKLCNNDKAPKRGKVGYDPAYKYDFLYKVIIDNVNALTRKAGSDLTGDETSWGHGGYGETGSGICKKLKGKPGISKGGQTVIVSDLDWIRPRAYVHRHNLHVKPAGFTVMGQVEVKMIMDKLAPMVEGEPCLPGIKKIFPCKPFMTFDNYFSGDPIMKYAGENGWGLLTTCRRDRLPAEIDGKYLYKAKEAANKVNRVGRFNHPITAIKEVPADGEKQAYTHAHVSFQSTGGTNLSIVNGLNENSMYIRRRYRGKGKGKRQWAIEMNDGRDLYLKTYWRIDGMDHLIQNCRMFYRSWKYWHAPMIHGKAMAVVVAYDMYQECCTGALDPLWKVNRPVDFWTFCDILSVQMLEYSPTRRKYPGDNAMRLATQQHASVRFHDPEQPITTTRGRPTNNIALQQYLKAKQDAWKAGGKYPRLCGDITMLTEHATTFELQARDHICVVCGEKCYAECKECGVHLHPPFSRRGNSEGKLCFFDWHNDCCLGITKHDHETLLRKRKKDFKVATPYKKKLQANYIKRIKHQARQPPPTNVTPTTPNAANNTQNSTAV
jgi:hypothetical protein